MDRLFFLFLIFSSITSCNSQKTNFKIFNENQNKICNDILEKNDSVLMANFDLPLNKAYYKYLQELNKFKSPDEIGKNILTRDSTLYRKLTEVGFFKLNKVRIYPKEGANSKKYYKSKYELNLESRYLGYLKKIAQNNKSITKYYEYLESSGDLLSPGATKIILNNFSEEDLDDENIRLIVGIHFLLMKQE